ncbi:MAG: NUDIX hydrolase [Ignavibacteriaceae bacterium]|nr:NUDIX hydrolase [Ignavibacteriaceae bacterium]
MSSENKYRFPLSSVRGIIQNDNGEILLLKRAAGDFCGGKWCLPGGKVEYGKRVDEALVLELKEETDLDCAEAKFLFYLDSLPSGEYRDHYIVFYFECKVKGEIKLNGESEEYRWVNPNDINNYDVAFGNKVSNLNVS